MTYWRHDELSIWPGHPDRALLIHHNDRPIAGAAQMPWRRCRALLRRVARGLAQVVATMHIAITAHKARRVRGALARLDAARPR